MSHTIYLHRNKITGKCYIGITNKTTEKRFAEHCAAANRGSPFAFHAAIRKHGKDSWAHEILAVCETRESAKQLEVAYIAEHKSTDGKCGYNMTRGGDGMVGMVRTEAHRAAISASLKGRIVSQEQRDKLAEYRGERASFYGRKQSDEWRKMMAHMLANNHPMKRHAGAKSKLAEEFVITHLDGTKENVKGLALWARERGYSGPLLTRVAAGKSDSAYGLEIEYADKNKREAAEKERAQRHASREGRDWAATIAKRKANAARRELKRAQV